MQIKQSEAISKRYKTSEEKIQYYKSLKVQHPYLTAAFKKTMELLSTTEKGKVYLVYGPTGVGKSTLLELIKEEMLYENKEIMECNKGLIPVVDYEIISEGNGKFNWKDFYIRFLDRINEPLIEMKQTQEQILKKNQYGGKYISPYQSDTAMQLRAALEKALKYRQVKVVLFDEAQHFLKISRTKSMYEHMDALKSIANITGTNFVLFGSFDLLQFLTYNAQTSRRTNEVYFPRYDLKRNIDRERFNRVITRFDKSLPFEKESRLIEHADFIYKRSIGCVGILRDWLLRCVEQVAKSGNDHISLKILERNAPSIKKAYSIGKETVEAETELRENAITERDLDILLGIDIDNDSTPKQNSKSKRLPGERSPVRDKVGLEYE